MSETTAKEIMSRELIHATEDMTIEQALKILIQYRITGLPVVNKHGVMSGVVSEFDIISQISQSKQKGPQKFQQVITYSKKVNTIRDDTPLSKIVKKFMLSKFRRLPVLDKRGRLVGMITRRDLMRVFYYQEKLGDQ